jgi:hypothetical protein
MPGSTWVAPHQPRVASLHVSRHSANPPPPRRIPTHVGRILACCINGLRQRQRRLPALLHHPQVHQHRGHAVVRLWVIRARRRVVKPVPVGAILLAILIAQHLCAVQGGAVRACDPQVPKTRQAAPSACATGLEPPTWRQVCGLPVTVLHSQRVSASCTHRQQQS